MNNYLIVLTIIACAIIIILGLIMATLNSKLQTYLKNDGNTISIDKTPMVAHDMYEDFLVDFRADRFLSGNIGIATTPVSYYQGHNVLGGGTQDEPRVQVPEKVVRIIVKPVDIVDELKTSPTKWSLEGIDDKIKMFKAKSEMIVQQYAKQEVNALIQCLEARKKYDIKLECRLLRNDAMETISHETAREYFAKYDITDEKKIDNVIKKHNLRMGDPDIFIPELPNEAIQTMYEYTQVVQEITNKKPRYYIIAGQNDFQKVEKKRDPILLGQSPFGFYYHILGAWDTEMLYLPEL